MKKMLTIIAAVLAVGPALAQNASSDEYTRYELLDPGSAKFRIVYDVTAVTPGATFYFNPIRKGSEASDESVIDRVTGEPLKFEVVSGAQARDAGFARADPDGSYIKVALARPVPRDGGEARIRILKTYRDPKSYYTEGDTLVFARPLGIRRNAVVLPAGYEVVSCNVPVQVIQEADSRIALSFIHTFPGSADLVLRARKIAKGTGNGDSPRFGNRPENGDRPRFQQPSRETVTAPVSSLRDMPVSERARQDREIVYFMQQPETHAFRLYHDYTESREGTDKYLNVVRAGSRVSNPSAKVLDTGEALKTETLRGDAIAKAGIDIRETVAPDTEVVIVRFPAVQKGRSTRLRIEETYTDPGRYGLVGDQLVWHRAFGRPANAILLPEGWYLTTSSVPATISEQEGKVRLDFVNPRNDEIDVYIKARRR